MTKMISERAGKIPSAHMIEHDPGYRKLMELDFTDMIPFVLTHIKRRSYISWIYAIVNAGYFISAVFIILFGLKESHVTWSIILRQTLIGMLAGSILIIPVHEMLHGLAYRFLGAKKIRFGADMKQFIFFVTADRFAVSGRGLYFLAMTPFVVINAVSLFVFRTWFPEIMLFPVVMLLCHNTMCIGDFAMVNFVILSPGRVLTFDKPEERKCYFYEELNS